MRSVIILFCVLLSTKEIQNSKILGVFSISAPSHYFLARALMRELAERGHDVTVISPFGEKDLPKNGSYRDIILTGLKEEFEERMKQIDFFEMSSQSVFWFLLFFVQFTLKNAENTLKHENVQKLINSGEKFDLVIVEQFLNEAEKGFAAHFKAPMIMLSPIGANTWVDMLAANPSPTSYVPDALLSYSSNMTFVERTKNSIFRVYSHLLYNYYSFPKQKQLYDKYFPNAPDFYETLYNSSIYLLNSHPSTNQPVPLVPNMIDIGGFHIKPTKTLPAHLQKFLDNSKNGVIYFSLGSNIKSSRLPSHKRDALIKTFAKLKYQILWKWETDDLPGKPENVRIEKWLPQQDILAHPNIKLFITHGGLLSTTETIYHGVPVLAIPVAADQKLNAQKIVHEGFGLSLSYSDLSEEGLAEKLNELLQNPKYAENAKKRSKIFHDRPVKPMDTAVYWVEYVIRHGGAPHLRVAGVDLPWYKYMLLDVIVFILATTLLSIFILFEVIKLVFSKYFGSNGKRKVKKN